MPGGPGRRGVGVGWVSIIHVGELAAILALPPNVVPAAYLCLGYVDAFPPQPELQTAGWLPRLPRPRCCVSRAGTAGRRRRGTTCAVPPRHPKSQDLKGRGDKAGETGMGTLHGTGIVYTYSRGAG